MFNRHKLVYILMYTVSLVVLSFILSNFATLPERLIYPSIHQLNTIVAGFLYNLADYVWLMLLTLIFTAFFRVITKNDGQPSGWSHPLIFIFGFLLLFAFTFIRVNIDPFGFLEDRNPTEGIKYFFIVLVLPFVWEAAFNYFRNVKNKRKELVHH